MLLKNNSARLITINEPLDVKKDADGKVLTATSGAKYDLLPAGEAVFVPDSLCESRFVKALLQANLVIISHDTGESGEDDEFDLEKMTKAELVAFAEENKIKVDPASKKAEILLTIQETLN